MDLLINPLFYSGKIIKNITTQIIIDYLEHQHKTTTIKHDAILCTIKPQNSIMDLIRPNIIYYLATDVDQNNNQQPTYQTYYNNLWITNNLNWILKSTQWPIISLERIILNVEMTCNNSFKDKPTASRIPCRIVVNNNKYTEMKTFDNSKKKNTTRSPFTITGPIDINNDSVHLFDRATDYSKQIEWNNKLSGDNHNENKPIQMKQQYKGISKKKFSASKIPISIMRRNKIQNEVKIEEENPKQYYLSLIRENTIDHIRINGENQRIECLNKIGRKNKYNAKYETSAENPQFEGLPKQPQTHIKELFENKVNISRIPVWILLNNKKQTGMETVNEFKKKYKQTHMKQQYQKISKIPIPIKQDNRSQNDSKTSDNVEEQNGKQFSTTLIRQNTYFITTNRLNHQIEGISELPIWNEVVEDKMLAPSLLVHKQLFNTVLEELREQFVQKQFLETSEVNGITSTSPALSMSNSSAVSVDEEYHGINNDVGQFIETEEDAMIEQYFLVHTQMFKTVLEELKQQFLEISEAFHYNMPLSPVLEGSEPDGDSDDECLVFPSVPKDEFNGGYIQNEETQFPVDHERYEEDGDCDPRIEDFAIVSSDREAPFSTFPQPEGNCSLINQNDEELSSNHHDQIVFHYHIPLTPIPEESELIENSDDE